MAHMDIIHSHNVIIGWIADYCVSYLSEADDMKQATMKSMISMVEQTSEDCLMPCYRLQHRLLHLVHILDSNYGSSDWIDTVVTAFNRVVQLLDHSMATQDCIRTAAINIKKEAVFAMCRQNLFDQAEEVFIRVWEESSMDLEQQTRRKVQSVLKSRDPSHTALQTPNAFKEMAASVQCIMKHVRRDLKQPFLQQASSRAVQLTQTKDDQEEEVTTHTGLILKGHQLRKLQVLRRLHRKEKSSPISQELVSRINKIRKKKAMYIASMPNNLRYGPSQIYIKAKVCTNKGIQASSGTTTRKRQSGLTYASRKRIISLNRSTPSRTQVRTDTAMWVMTDGHSRDSSTLHRKNEYNSSSESTISEDIFVKPMPSLRARPVQFRQSLAPDNISVISLINSTSSRRRNDWQRADELRLYEAVKALGPGKWAKIIKTFDFPDRTNVQLKDKWRNMVQSGRVTELTDLYEKQ